MRESDRGEASARSVWLLVARLCLMTGQVDGSRTTPAQASAAKVARHVDATAQHADGCLGGFSLRWLGLLLGTLLLAGCSALGGGSTVGSLGTLTPDAHQCSVMHGATWLIEGSNALNNAGEDPVVITKIELVHPMGFALSSARLGPIGHHGKHGTFIMGVRPRGVDAADQWMVDESVPALGAVIKPGQEVNLLLFLKAPNSNGSMMPPRVTYIEDGKTRVWNGGETLTTVAGSNCPRDFTAAVTYRDSRLRPLAAASPARWR